MIVIELDLVLKPTMPWSIVVVTSQGRGTPKECDSFDEVMQEIPKEITKALGLG